MAKSRKCEECDKPIPKARLEVVPDTTFCVECSKEHAPDVKYEPDIYCARPSTDDD